MAAITAFLLLIAIAVLALLVQAIRQNLVLWREVRGINRSVPRLLWDALVLWSPLALVILVLAFAAMQLTAAAISMTYRLTTLDEFCEIEDVPGRYVIPCTGMDDEIAGDTIRLAGAQADLDEFVSRKYAETRRRFLGLSMEQLRASASSRRDFYRTLSPQGVFSLEPAPEDDAELVRLKQELRELVRTRVKPARDVLDVVRFVTERDARVRRMRVLTAMVLARRERVNQEAYAGLNSTRQGQLWLQHRIAHLLAQAASRVDPATDAALTQAANAGTGEGDALLRFRRGILSMLAKDEAVTAEILARDAKTRTGSAALYLALFMPRRCTVATPEKDLRLRAADFAVDDIESIDLDRVTQSNAGTFRCIDSVGDVGTFRLRALGFKESVRRSIDRWHEETVRSSARSLGVISLGTVNTAAEAKVVTRRIASVVPSTIHLGRAECGWLHPANCVANAAREAVEAGYESARAEAQRRYELAADQATDTAALTLDQQVGQALLTLDSRLADMREGAHEYAGRIFLIGDLIRFLGWLAVALIAIKSYLYVLALELFHSDEEMAIAFDDAKPVEGEYRSARRLTIDRDFPYPLITRKQLSNTDNNVCIAPWPWSAPLARILRGRYFLFTKGRFLADAEQASGSVDSRRGMVASAGGGMSIVEWTMQPGEEVIFRYKDFYGASENVQLASEISFRLATLLLGRIIFRIARCTEGEGRLLLKADVEEIAQEDIRALPPERMIAWNRHARFSVHSGRTLWKTLLNGYTLVRRNRGDGPSGKIVVSSDEAGSNLGSIRFVRRIFSAIF
jgi:hypothetical protein